MGILRRLREWREDKNGTLIGPDIDADSVDAGSVKADELNGDVSQKSGETVQSALNRAESGDRVILQAGDFAESVDLDTPDVSVFGAGRGTHIKDGFEVLATGCHVENIRVGQADQSNSFGFRANVNKSGVQELEIESIWVTGAEFEGLKIFDGSDTTRVNSVYIASSNVGGNDLVIEADRCLVDGIIGAVTDNGTNNSIGDTV